MSASQSGQNIIERPNGGAKINGTEIYRRVSIRRRHDYENNTTH
jgi:hypothetical protein